MEKYIMTRRAFLLGCGAVTGSAALCFATARKAALFPGVDPALDDEKNGYLLERRRAQTLEGVITGSTARPLPSRVKRACRLLSLKRHLQA